MSTLNEVYGLNKYCGPAVISALTGRSTEECAQAIGFISGQTTIKAVQVNHLLETCRRLGFIVNEVPLFSRTLFGVLLNLSKTDGKYIVLVPQHVVAVECKDFQIFLVDNHTKRPINAASSARLSQPVDRVWRITGKSAEELLNERIAARKKYISEQLEILHREIESRTRIRFELEMELNQLERGGLV